MGCRICFADEQLPRCEHGAVREPCVPCHDAALATLDAERETVRRLREALADLLEFTEKAMDSSGKYIGQPIDIKSIDRAEALLAAW